MKKAIFLAHVKDAARQQGGTLQEYLKKARELALGNVSPGAVCGWLQWELR